MNFKNMVERKDILLTAFFAAAAAAVIGVIDATVLPDAASGGYGFENVVASVGSLDATTGLIVALVAATVAFGSDRLYDLTDSNSDVEPVDAAAFAASTVPLIAHESFATVSDITAGEPIVQLLFLAPVLAGMITIARTP